MSPRQRILVAGSANLDFVVRAGTIPSPGETVLGRDFQIFPGGKGANQAVASARAGGAATSMLVALGEDDYAERLEASLRAAGVELTIRRQRGVPTGSAFICVSDDGENAITVAPGANACLLGSDLPALDDIGLLLLQLETPLPAIEAWARRARAAGVRVALNAAPAHALPQRLLALIDLLVVNESELAALTGIGDDIGAALARLPVPMVVVTLGALGCCARIDGVLHPCPGFAVEAVDTTAAGDTFCGVLVAALAGGADPEPALARACAASALACTGDGAQSSIPARDEVEAFLAAAPAVDAGRVAALRARCDLA